MTHTMPPEGAPETEPAPTALLKYLRDVMTDAIAKQRTELDRGDTVLHGAFIRRILPGTRPQGSVLEGTAEMLLTLPYSESTPQSNDRAWVCAVLPADYQGEGFYELDTTRVNAFYVRKIIDGLAGPLWLVDNTGVHLAEVTTVPNRSQMSPEELAEQMYQELSAYNMTAAKSDATNP